MFNVEWICLDPIKLLKNSSSQDFPALIPTVIIPPYLGPLPFRIHLWYSVPFITQCILNLNLTSFVHSLIQQKIQLILAVIDSLS